MQGIHCHTPMEDVIETPIFSGKSLAGLSIPLILLKYLADIENLSPGWSNPCSYKKKVRNGSDHCVKSIRMSPFTCPGPKPSGAYILSD